MPWQISSRVWGVQLLGRPPGWRAGCESAEGEEGFVVDEDCETGGAVESEGMDEG